MLTYGIIWILCLIIGVFMIYLGNKESFVNCTTIGELIICGCIFFAFIAISTNNSLFSSNSNNSTNPNNTNTPAIQSK